jgi:peptidoglycan/LPS O-acetylase OafA/YrhL
MRHPWSAGMPEPIKRNQRYMPGLDGLRAIAVLAVIAYHLDFKWATGGLLGVGVFFTLSGYLITDLLLAQLAQGRIHLRAFWLARARRLLPALFAMLIIVTAWVTVLGPHQPPEFRSAVGTAVVYVNNWWLVFHDVSYFQAFEAQGPLNHLWSLSIEEQFYILWPFLLVLGVAFIPEIKSRTGTRVRLAGAALGLGFMSALLMAVLYQPGLDPSRVYYGTDTRALELLVGAALAAVWPSRRLRSNIAPRARRIIDRSGTIGLTLIVLMLCRLDEFSPFLYRGGFLLLSLATVLVLAALVHPASRLGPALGCRPLRWIGVRSYGIYLWHFPVIVLTTPAGAHGFDPARAFLQLAAVVGIAALSWRFIENPIRQGALASLWSSVKAGWGARQCFPWSSRLAAAGAGAVLLLALAGFAGVGGESGQSTVPGKLALARTVTTPASDRGPRRTSCKSVVHVGDSTSEGLVSREYLPNPKQLISARYARVGVRTQHLEVSGGRSIYETVAGAPNANDVAASWKGKGYKGCWVLALGTNETANVSVGSAVGLDDRIDTMMSTLGDARVMWVNVKSLVASGPYAAGNMKLWNDALLRACARYPKMLIYDWAADLQDAWFIPDGIHFTSEGYAARGALIARALLKAFPASAQNRSVRPAGCLIQSGRPGPAFAAGRA